MTGKLDDGSTFEFRVQRSGRGKLSKKARAALFVIARAAYQQALREPQEPAAPRRSKLSRAQRNLFDEK